MAIGNFTQFVSIAKGSVGETRDQLLYALEFGHLRSKLGNCVPAKMNKASNGPRNSKPDKAPKTLDPTCRGDRSEQISTSRARAGLNEHSRRCSGIREPLSPAHTRRLPLIAFARCTLSQSAESRTHTIYKRGCCNAIRRSRVSYRSHRRLSSGPTMPTRVEFAHHSSLSLFSR